MSYLSFMVTQIGEKRKQLERLRTSKTNMNQLQGEFNQYTQKVKQPELSTTTWQGTRANEFEEVREQFNEAYRDISQSQMDSAITSIESKISSLEVEIAALEVSMEKEVKRLEEENKKDPIM